MLAALDVCHATCHPHLLPFNPSTSGIYNQILEQHARTILLSFVLDMEFIFNACSHQLVGMPTIQNCSFIFDVSLSLSATNNRKTAKVGCVFLCNNFCYSNRNVNLISELLTCYTLSIIMLTFQCSAVTRSILWSNLHVLHVNNLNFLMCAL